MALDPSDGYYLAEIVPASIEAMASPLCAAYGVGRDSFGDKGNVYHDFGYHRSREWILNSPDSRNGYRDYSVQDERDWGGDQRWISAFDFTPGEWGTPDNRAKMIELTKRMRAAARARDPRLADLREIAGTEDGAHVVTFKAQGGDDLTPFDSTHLDHLHGSFWRDGAARDHQGIVGVMLGVAIDEEDEHMSMGAIKIEVTETNISVPGGSAGGGNRQKWLAVCNETALGPDGKRPQYALRVVATTGNNSWTAVFHDASGNLTMLPKFDSGKVYGFTLPLGVRAINIVRAPIGTDGKVYDPESATPPPVDAVTYGGSLSCSVEG